MRRKVTFTKDVKSIGVIVVKYLDPQVYLPGKLVIWKKTSTLYVLQIFHVP